MTYLHKISSDEGIVKYEYGADKGEYIGYIEFRVDVPTNTAFEERNLKLVFYGDYSFNRLTSSALQSIAAFIRENEFPDNYLRATH